MMFLFGATNVKVAGKEKNLFIHLNLLRTLLVRNSSFIFGK